MSEMFSDENAFITNPEIVNTNETLDSRLFPEATASNYVITDIKLPGDGPDDTTFTPAYPKDQPPHNSGAVALEILK